MDFGANKMPVEVIKEGVIGETYFRDIYSSVNAKWQKRSWKEFDQLKDIDQRYYCSSYYDVSVNKYGVKCSTLFQWYFRYWLGRRSQDNKRQINRWKGIVSRFKGKLVKMITDAGSKYDGYSILPKIRQILLHWGYELIGKDFFTDLTN